VLRAVLRLAVRGKAHISTTSAPPLPAKAFYHLTQSAFDVC
jgi:hypothetical protein